MAAQVRFRIQLSRHVFRGIHRPFQPVNTFPNALLTSAVRGLASEFVVSNFHQQLRNQVRMGLRVPNVNDMANRTNELMHQLHMQASSSPHYTPAEEKTINDLPLKHVESVDCSICFEHNPEPELVRELPCKHQFHKDCIDKWLRVNNTCPNCNHRVR